MVVLPSGSFIISTVTLPGYFDKDNLQSVTIDAGQDIEVFSKWIAPAFRVTCRFAGEESLDKFTMQYNKTMERELPQYGIEFFEIKRLEKHDEPISATKVRKALEIGDFDSIREMVPPTTYDYLIKTRKR